MGERVGACLRGCVRRTGSEGIPNVGIGVEGARAAKAHGLAPADSPKEAY